MTTTKNNSSPRSIQVVHACGHVETHHIGRAADRDLTRQLLRDRDCYRCDRPAYPSWKRTEDEAE